jgi:DNA-directed RNA polymerase subunit RPC12/RpoP
MRKLSLEEFILRSQSIHKNNFNYTRSLYVDALTKIIIICNKCGEEFSQTSSGHLSGKGCPFCSGRMISKNNCLLATHPLIAAQLDDDKNLIGANEIMPGSAQKMWWKCKKNHSWLASLNSRTSGGNGCPYCSNQLVNEENSLAIINPIMSKELHPTKNILKAEEIIYGSNHHFWWICSSCSFEWNTSLDKRKRGTGCPRCAKNYSEHGDYFSTKNNVNIKYDSAWERERMEELDHINTISRWYRCKDKIPYFDTSSNRYRKYNPDFEIKLFDESIVIEEVKAITKRRYEQNICKFRAANIYYKALNKNYRVVTRECRWLKGNYVVFDFDKVMENK